MQFLFSSPISLIVHVVTEATGRITCQFSAEEIVQQAGVFIRTVESTMTFHATILGADSTVLRPVKRWGAMTLLTERIPRLVQQPLVGTAVRTVAGDTAAITFSAERTGRVVLKPIRAGLVGMASEAVGAAAVTERRLILAGKVVTADAGNVAINERMI